MINRIIIIISVLLTLTIIRSHAGPYLIFDANTGEAIDYKQVGRPWYPASLTKLMTTYITFKSIRSGRISLNTKLIISKYANSQPPSKSGLPAGATVTLDKALKLLITRSNNDIAVAIAEAISGSEERFIFEMNQTARYLGMNGTSFANPHGLPNRNNISTARDIGILSLTIIREFPEYNSYFSLPYVKIGKKKLSNRNRLLKSMYGADGMKTGFICDSGHNLVASATRGNQKLIAVIFGALTAKERTKQAKYLLERSFQKVNNNFSIRGRKIITFNNENALMPKSMAERACKPKKKRKVRRRNASHLK